MKKFLNIKALLICLSLFSFVFVLAYSYNASDVGFTPTPEDWDVDNTSDALNDLYLRTQRYLVGFDVSTNKSAVFSVLTITPNDLHSDIEITINPVFRSGYSSDNVSRYILLVDDEIYGYSDTPSIKMLNYEADTRYFFQVIALTKDAKMHYSTPALYLSPAISYEREVLAYPLITADGIMNVRYVATPDISRSYYAYDDTVETTASDSMPRAAYDNDLETYAGPYNIVYKYFDVDPSAYGKKITVKNNGAYSNYTCGSFSSDTRKSTFEFTIPSGATRLYAYGNEGLRFYEFIVN